MEPEDESYSYVRRSERVVKKISVGGDSRRFGFPVQMKSLFWSPNPCLKKYMTLIHRSPNVYLVQNFLSPGEADHLDSIVTQHREKLKARSFTESTLGEKVVSDHRTSTFVFLRKCGDAKVRRIEERAADIVGLPVLNVEPMQVVSYSQGQYFGLHHDLGTLRSDGSVVEPEAGANVRLVTFFVYLNSLPIGAGGATVFPKLDCKVTPERGSALLFSNVREDGSPDPLVVHEAASVQPGYRKFGLNLWIGSSSMAAYSLSKSGVVYTGKESQRKRKRVIAKYNKTTSSDHQIQVEWEDNVWYNAIVTSTNARGVSTLIYPSSNTTETVKLCDGGIAHSVDGSSSFKWRHEKLLPSVDDFILVEWQDGEWYLGKITAIKKGLYGILYPNSDTTECLFLKPSGVATTESKTQTDEFFWKLMERDLDPVVAMDCKLLVDWEGKEYTAQAVGYSKLTGIYTLLYSASHTVETAILRANGTATSPDGVDKFSWKLALATHT